MHRLSLMVLGMALLASSPALTQTSCVRHFYNRSNYQWSISGYDGVNSNLIIAPNTTVEIPWGTSTSVVVSGTITGRTYTRQFHVQPADSCFVINHQGNTGNIILNKPTNGDVTTCVGNC